MDYPPIIGNTPEEIRISSARSRASIRSHHKSVLEVQRAVTEERRVKSPLLNIHAQKSVLTDAELNEDGDMPFPDDVKSEYHNKKNRYVHVFIINMQVPHEVKNQCARAEMTSQIMKNGQLRCNYPNWKWYHVPCMPHA